MENSNKKPKRKIILFFVFLIGACAAIVFFTYQKAQEKQFKTNLIAAACVGAKNTLVYPDTAKFNNSLDSYVVSNQMKDGSYNITGYIEFIDKNKERQKKAFTVQLKYNPDDNKPYQIIDAKLK